MASRKRARTSSSSSSGVTVVLAGSPLGSKMAAFWRAGDLTDVVVTVEGRSFPAHRLVLAAGAEYFEKLFKSECRDREAPTIKDELPAAAFEPLLAFLYEGSVAVAEELITPLLHAADYLGVEPLKKAAAGALVARLAPSNALATWALAERLSLPSLAEAAKQTALRGFEELGESLLEAPLAQVEALVADDRLTAQSEESVFSAVALVAEKQRPAEAALLAVLRHLRFPLMRREFLQQTVGQWPLLHSAAGKQMLFESTLAALHGSIPQPRVGFGPRHLYMVGGRAEASANNLLATVEMYDVLAKTWAAGTAMSTARTYAAAAVLGGKLYVLGGFNGTTLASVEAFDPQTGTWAAVAPMGKGRQLPAAAAVGGKLYAIGGFGSPYLSGVEAFDPQTGTWTEVASMPTARAGAGAAVLDGKIYVVGGSMNGVLDTVEVHDPATNAWSVGPPMQSARRYFGTAVLGGKLYVAGGDENRTTCLSSVEVFDPQTNAWTELAPMSTGRFEHQLAAAQGKLYAVGGKTTGSVTLSSVEAYDPQQNRWEAAAPLSGPRYRHATAAM